MTIAAGLASSRDHRAAAADRRRAPKHPDLQVAARRCRCSSMQTAAQPPGRRCGRAAIDSVSVYVGKLVAADQQRLAAGEQRPARRGDDVVSAAAFQRSRQPGRNRVAAGAALEHVAVAAREQVVVARPAAQRVPSGAAVEVVAAGAAVEHVGARATRQVVVAGAPDQPVVAGSAAEIVCAVVAEQHVVPVAAGHAADGADPVALARRAVEVLGVREIDAHAGAASPVGHAAAAGTADHDVSAAAGVRRARGRERRAVAVAAEARFPSAAAQDVVAGAAPEEVHDRVVALVARQRAVAARQQVVARSAVEPSHAGQDIVTIAAFHGCGKAVRGRYGDRVVAVARVNGERQHRRCHGRLDHRVRAAHGPLVEREAARTRDHRGARVAHDDVVGNGVAGDGQRDPVALARRGDVAQRRMVAGQRADGHRSR